MTEHSTEELRRQMEAAQSVAKAAQLKAQKATKHYHERLCQEKIAAFEAMGGRLNVTRVRVPERSDCTRPDMLKGPFLVVGAEMHTWRDTAKYRLANIKKDGTPSNAPSNAGDTVVFILPEDQPSATPEGRA